MTALFVVLVLGYVLGSFNSALVLLRLAGKTDPRQAYSGNPGVTNVYRIAGPAWALAVLALDVARAALVGWAARRWLEPATMPLACLALVVGTRFPFLHGFRGGKGVASCLGFALGALGPLVVFSALSVWLVVWVILRRPFLASIPMVTLLWVWMVIHGGFAVAACVGGFGAWGLVLLAHHKNFAELVRKPTILAKEPDP
jgi:glycerol-3-phosphate acyltransferase PlsY